MAETTLGDPEHTAAPVERPADMATASGADQSTAEADRPLARLIPLEEVADRLLLTRDGAYRLLRRAGLPYLLVGSRMGPRRRLHYRIGVTVGTFWRLLQLRAAGARRRGTWTEEDYRDVGLAPEAPES